MRPLNISTRQKMIIFSSALLVIVMISGIALSLRVGSSSDTDTSIATKDASTKLNANQTTTPTIEKTLETTTTAAMSTVPEAPTTTTTLPIYRDDVPDDIFDTPMTPPEEDVETPVVEVVEPASDFVSIGYIRMPGYWLVVFEWTPSPTPGVSYCISRDATITDTCSYDELRMAPTFDFVIGVGDTDAYKYFLVAVSPSGVRSTHVSTIYAI